MAVLTTRPAELLIGNCSSRSVGRRWAEHVGEERYAIFEEILSEIAEVSRARRPRADPRRT